MVDIQTYHPRLWEVEDAIKNLTKLVWDMFLDTTTSMDAEISLENGTVYKARLQIQVPIPNPTPSTAAAAAAAAKCNLTDDEKAMILEDFLDRLVPIVFDYARVGIGSFQGTVLEDEIEVPFVFSVETPI